MSSSPGLRERKKEQTRQLIADTAREFFAQRGFDTVTVAEIARAADVSEATVFNYFPTKEDLVYGRMEAFEDELLAAVRDRAPGESALQAFGRFVLQRRGLLAAKNADERLLEITRMIAESPALLAREEQIFLRYTQSLASLLEEETGARADDVQPWVAANALMGVHRGLIAYVRRQVLAGKRNPRLARDVRAQGERALVLLESGLGRYAVKAGRPRRNA
jgi:AcrR family transcriptional regulator